MVAMEKHKVTNNNVMNVDESEAHRRTVPLAFRGLESTSLWQR